jgi:N-methylhydantoinase A/oxoprolinase/acetone carboxylase beta subunit
MKRNTVHVVSCAVLAKDYRAAAERLGVACEFTFLPGGLHDRPDLLREKLQEEIDRLSQLPDTHRVILGYGVCGRGTVGIRARGVPLVIPRVQDCIALFLGSDAAYREQFSQYPGTYYVATGWVEGMADKGEAASDGKPRSNNYSYADLVTRYGDDNADVVQHFLDSWQRNYQRAVFIDTGLFTGTEDRCERLARQMATDFGWRFERLDGTQRLLSQSLAADETDDEILVVPPEHEISYDGVRRRLHCGLPVSADDRVTGCQVLRRTGDDAAATARRGMGLGIDAGGTFTDAAIYDFDANRVVAAAKSPTTKWDCSVGMSAALGELPSELLSQVAMVSVSTTLATNAIVEGDGQRVGLLLMPPYGCFDARNFQHEPIAVVQGQVDIDGTELQPIDEEEVRQTVRRMMTESGVAAFAVGGFASHANPMHEVAIERIVREESGCPVTSSHMLSEGLNYRVRAETAALNARIIPCLDRLLGRVGHALEQAGIDAPVMLVRSDGSMMSLEMARERPLETMLSGPAASVAGAVHMTGLADALVVDVGGTTTDTAWVSAGDVQICEEGATIGGWQTHVRALDICTAGLGGDSRVLFSDNLLSLSPRRVTPVSWLFKHEAGAADGWRWIETMDPDARAPELLYLTAAGRATLAAGEAAEVEADELAILTVLVERPCSPREVAQRVDKVHPRFLALARLEANQWVQRAGVTPTDALHGLGTLDFWSQEGAQRCLSCMAMRAGLTMEALCTAVLECFTDGAMQELSTRLLLQDGVPPAEASRDAQALCAAVKRGDGAALRVTSACAAPIIGIGAPAALLLKDAVARLGGELIVPEHAAVANAVGAITGGVSVVRRLTVAATDDGRFRVEGIAAAPVFASVEEATECAADHLELLVRGIGKQAGATDVEVTVTTVDRAAALAGGEVCFLGRCVEARLLGSPAATR